jgi:hypothetical protein
MSKCVKCKSRKGKRICPVLSALICPLCCGKHREKYINCPDSCRYLVKHRTYQEKKDWLKYIARPEIVEKKHDEIYKDEKFAWLAYNIEKVISNFTSSNPKINDRKVIKALEYALDKLKKEKSLIYLPEKSLEEKDELGEVIYNSLENIRYPRELLVPESEQLYKNEEKIKCLKNLIFSVKLFSKGELDGQNYINYVRKRIKQMIKEGMKRKIIIPH